MGKIMVFVSCVVKDFSKCRTCYQHIGGKFATNFFSFLVHNDYVKFIEKSNFSYIQEKLPILITCLGIDFFHSLDIDINIKTSAFACLDGTEKRAHLAGQCGSRLLSYMLDKNFVSKNMGRELICTEAGQKFLRGEFS